MNVWAIILALIAIGCLVVAYEGTQNNVFAAVTGKPVADSVISGEPASTTANVGTTSQPNAGVTLAAAQSQAATTGGVVE